MRLLLFHTLVTRSGIGAVHPMRRVLDTSSIDKRLASWQ